MVFFWVILYGLIYSLAQNLSLVLHLPITPAAMICYIVMLFVYLLHTGQSKRVGLQWPAHIRPLEYLPFLALPVCNLLYAQPVNHDWHVIILLSCAAITEELLFRGVLLEHLPLGHMPALFLSSLAFALLHAANLVSSPVQHVFLQIICAFFFGVCAGAATLLHKSLIPALAAHLLINLTGARTQLPSQTLIVCIAIYTIYGLLLCRRLRDVS